MISLDEVKKYLPQYLSESASVALFDELKQFPKNIDKRIYTGKLKNDGVVYQGDGLRGLLCIKLPDLYAKPVPSMVFSNTCDVDNKNKRLFQSRLVYAPIFDLNKYEKSLIRKYVDTGKKSMRSIETHIEDIKKQNISQIFYLPKGGNLINESMVFFDRVNNLPSDYLARNDIAKNRVFSLSDYGFYIFLFKLSIHFSRIRENVRRS